MTLAEITTEGWSPMLDYYLQLGVCLDQLGRMSCELSLDQGLIRVFSNGQEIGLVGVRDVDPSVWDWQHVIKFLSELSHDPS